MVRGMVTTGWRAGRLSGTGTPRLVFGRMYEDAAIELAALPAGRVLAIASAGDVAFALAREGRDVTAVDFNPAQVA
jgi:S-adenosylmethionine:diacylglycerol 3-amino-3-carboxypropyl transferase